VQVNSDKDGVTDLEDLGTALSKWAGPGSQNLLHAFATARGIAFKFYTTEWQDSRGGDYKWEQ